MELRNISKFNRKGGVPVNTSWTKTAHLLAAGVVLALSLSGCGAKQTSQLGSSPSGGQSEPSKMEIKVYRTDDQLAELKEQTASISYTSEEEKLTAALGALADADPNGGISLWKGVEFKKVTFKDGDAVADIHLPTESRLGAPGEQLALDALRKTVFQFDEIKTFDLLIDGQAAESLMGHVELDHPMKRDDN